MVAVRANQQAAAVVGVDVARTKATAFALAGALGAVAGALYGAYKGYVGPEDWGLLVRRTNRLRGSHYLEYDDRRRCTAIWQDGHHRLRRYQYDDRRRTVLVTGAFGRRTLWRFLDPSLMDEEVRFDGAIVRRIYFHSRQPMAIRRGSLGSTAMDGSLAASPRTFPP